MTRKNNYLVPTWLLSVYLVISPFLFAYLAFPPGTPSYTTSGGVNVEIIDDKKVGMPLLGIKKDSTGLAFINGSKTRIAGDNPRISVFMTCNHEMMHINGYTHGEMTYLEMMGMRFDTRCTPILHPLLLE